MERHDDEHSPLCRATRRPSSRSAILDEAHSSLQAAWPLIASSPLQRQLVNNASGQGRARAPANRRARSSLPQGGTNCALTARPSPLPAPR
ncbi:MAG: hypothetical protein SGPRY_001071, partial [Prymnesium sp.]